MVCLLVFWGRLQCNKRPFIGSLGDVIRLDHASQAFVHGVEPFHQTSTPPQVLPCAHGCIPVPLSPESLNYYEKCV